jgi:FixJ family two-component response regulator
MCRLPPARSRVGLRSNIRKAHSCGSITFATSLGPRSPHALHTPVTNKKNPLIAIVDDDESVCRALERLIRSLGMTAETYSNSVEFVDLLDALPSFQPDCVVLDMQMPGLSGVEVQAHIRRTRGAIPIIFITAHDDRVSRERALSGGAVAFLRKPFTDALLIRTLDVALGRGETGAEHIGPVCGE